MAHAGWATTAGHEVTSSSKMGAPDEGGTKCKRAGMGACKIKIAEKRTSCTIKKNSPASFPSAYFRSNTACVRACVRVQGLDHRVEPN